MIILKTTIKIIAVSSLFVAMSSAQAALVSFTLTGDVTFDDTFTGTNVFGLPVGTDNVTATGTFDSSLIGDDLISGSGSFSLSNINNLLITVGSETFTAADDNGSGIVTIINGTVIDELGSAGFVYAGTNTNQHLFTSDASDNFIGTENGGLSNILGEWTSYEMTVVPVPAAAWLFGSGLLGLVGLARRKAA